MQAVRINDRVKLLRHRMYARRLAAEPSLVDRARGVLAVLRETRPHAPWMAEWDALLRLPVGDIRRFIVRRTEKAAHLRLSSPFALVDGLRIADEAIRRRVWRVAKRGVPSSAP
jgi:hypothetical protein